MKPDDVATAITNALVQGGSSWLIASIVAFLPALWTTALMLHLGRPYVIRTLRRCGLRLGADVWWMSYLLMRDAVLLMTFALSWFFFEPNIVASSALPITGSLATLFLLLALAVKLSRRVDDDINAYRLATVFLVVGATLYYFPLVFAVEAASQPALANIGAWWTSSSNVTVALWLMWVSLGGVALVAAYLFGRALASVNRKSAAKMQPPTAPVRSRASAA
ncbi:MAG TPA: hypothetical protein VF812_16180 [Ktedonobacterales bacterium]